MDPLNIDFLQICFECQLFKGRQIIKKINRFSKSESAIGGAVTAIIATAAIISIYTFGKKFSIPVLTIFEFFGC